MAKGDYKWSARRRAYIYGNGRAVSSQTVAGWVRAYAERTENVLGALSDKLVAGEISREDWYSAMKDEIKDGQRLAGLVANGGRKNMTLSHWGKTGVSVREQLKYLDRFYHALPDELTSAISARARLYAAAFYPAYVEHVKRRDEAAGATHERSLLTVAENCASCIVETSRGWVKMGALVPIGARACLVRCKCEYETGTFAKA